MTSLKSQIIYLMMHNRHLFKFKLKPETWDFNTSVPAFRQLCEESNAKMTKQIPKGVKVSALQIGDIYAEWLTPTAVDKNKVILYTIGGGYVSGTCSDHRQFVAKVAQRSRVAILMFNHGLAPENPYPAALNDSVNAYQWLLDQGIASKNIVIMGESAGGGLCLATLLAIHDKGMPLPAGSVALSPWTDLKLTGESYRTKADVCISPPGMSAVCSKYYYGDNDPEDPWISPLYGDLHGLPPLFINVGEYETMLDDSTRFAEKAKAAGVDTTLVVGEKMIHCYPLLAPMFPEATQAMDEICGFIRKCLGV
jgi:epsilon-lactone hydrolase